METTVKRKADAENVNVAENPAKKPKVGATAILTASTKNVGQSKNVGKLTISQLRLMLKEAKQLTGVNHLTVDDCNWQSGKKDAKSYNDVVRSIPSLIGLTIDRSPKFPIEEFCKLNPQLERLKLKNGSDWRIRSPLLESIDKALPKLKHLEIQFQFTHNDFDYGVERFKNLESLHVYAQGKSFGRALQFVNFPGTQLTSLQICVVGACKRIIDKSFVQIVRDYKNLKDLTILSWLDNTKLSLVADHLPPTVEVFHIQGGKVTTTGVVDLIKKCKQQGKQLRKFEISPGCKKVYDEDIEKFCGPLKKKKDCTDWNVGDDGGGVIIIEKKSEK